MNNSFEEVEIEELEAASEMFDKLLAGTFYEEQENSGFTINYITKD